MSPKREAALAALLFATVSLAGLAAALALRPRPEPASARLRALEELIPEAEQKAARSAALAAAFRTLPPRLRVAFRDQRERHLIEWVFGRQQADRLKAERDRLRGQSGP